MGRGGNSRKKISKPRENLRDKIKFKDSQKKLNEILRQMDMSTFENRVKVRLIGEYAKGRFFDIPQGLFNGGTRYDDAGLKNLKNLFEFSSVTKTFIPENLYDFSNESDRERLRVFLKEKGYTLDEKTRMDLKVKLAIPYNLKIKPDNKSDIYYEYRLPFKGLRTKREEIEEKIRTARHAANMIKGKRYVDDNVEFDIHERRLYIYLLDVYRGVVSISGKSLSEVLPKLEELDELYLGERSVFQKAFFDTRNEVVKNIVEDSGGSNNSSDKLNGGMEISEEIKANIFKILNILKECGALGELIDKENNLISYLNEFLPEESKFEVFDEEYLRDEIESLDVTKVDDLIDLLLINRHFSNKIAHVYEDYMFTNVFVNSREKNVIFGDKNSSTLGMKDRIIIRKFSFVDQFIEQDFYRMSENEKEQAKDEFIERVLMLRNDYRIIKEFQEKHEEEHEEEYEEESEEESKEESKKEDEEEYVNENVLRRMKIALILNPNENEVNSYSVLKNARDTLTADEIKLLTSQSSSNVEIDRIISKVFGEQETAIVDYLSEGKYKQKQSEIKSLRKSIGEIADDIIKSKENAGFANAIIRDIAKKRGKEVPQEYNSNTNIYATIAFFGLEKEYVFKEINKLMRHSLKKLPKEVRKWPNDHKKLEEECEKAGLKPWEIFLVKNKHKIPKENNKEKKENKENKKKKKNKKTLKLKKLKRRKFSDKDKKENKKKQKLRNIFNSEKEIEAFLNKMNQSFDALPGLKQEIIDCCDKPLIKNCDSKEKYCYERTVQFKKILEDYQLLMLKEVELGIRKNAPNVYDVVSALLTNEEDSRKFYVPKNPAKENIVEELKNVKIEHEFVQVSFVDLVREFESEVRFDGIIQNVYQVFTMVAKQVDLDRKLYTAKHESTTKLLDIAKENPGRIYLEGCLPTAYSDGLINVLKDGVYQKNSCHNKLAELNDLKNRTLGMFAELGEHSNYYKEDKQNKCPLNTYIYRPTMSSFQRKGFQTTAKLIASIDGKYKLEEDSLTEEECQILEKLKALKEEKPNVYASIKPRFMLGAGVEYYKSFYGITEGRFEDTVYEEEWKLSIRISEDKRKLEALFESFIKENNYKRVENFIAEMKNRIYDDSMMEELNRMLNEKNYRTIRLQER